MNQEGQVSSKELFCILKEEATSQHPPLVTGPVEDFLSNKGIMVGYRTSVLNLGCLALKSCVTQLAYLNSLCLVFFFFSFHHNEMI